VLKFPAAQRKNVYRERPFHEQSVWLERMRSDMDFEATQLARMIATDQITRALPARRLIRILAQVLKKRLRWRLTRRSGYKGLLWFAKGAGIGRQKQYKGLE
jgi:hypothetical protein